MRFILGSDLHLDLLSDEERYAFFARVAQKCDDPATVLLVTGDISSQKTLRKHIDELAAASKARVLYVLGNHDYWGGSFAQANASLESHGSPDGHAVFMDLVDRVQLDHVMCVVGESGWYDARNGWQGAPKLIMNDWYLIDDFRNNSQYNVKAYSEIVADARAAVLEKKLRDAVADGNERVVVLTHVPPYVEACRHLGRPSDEEGLPFFSSQVFGDVIDQTAKENPNVMFEVLCGHTHDGFMYQRDVNVVVRVSAAAYGAPYVHEWAPSLW